MDFNKLASQIPEGAKERLLEKIDDLKASIQGEGKNGAESSTPPSASEADGVTDQFVESRKPVSSGADTDIDTAKDDGLKDEE